MTAERRNEKVTYEWCQYVKDQESGLYTIRKITQEDHCKVFSQSEAIAYCNRMNKGEQP